jgi:hypothetical protein
VFVDEVNNVVTFEKLFLSSKSKNLFEIKSKLVPINGNEYDIDHIHF